MLSLLGLTSYQSKPEEEAANETAAAAVNAVPITHISTATASDDYYQTVVITSLLTILKDQSLSSHHHTVIEAIMSIFKTQGLKCVTFLPQAS
jgi:FKBP12-rapamycin complex-associated protein